MLLHDLPNTYLDGLIEYRVCMCVCVVVLVELIYMCSTSSLKRSRLPNLEVVLVGSRKFLGRKSGRARHRW
jgi:predicted nucleic acid-binding protein